MPKHCWRIQKIMINWLLYAETVLKSFSHWSALILYFSTKQLWVTIAPPQNKLIHLRVVNWSVWCVPGGQKKIRLDVVYMYNKQCQSDRILKWHWLPPRLYKYWSTTSVAWKLLLSDDDLWWSTVFLISASHIWKRDPATRCGHICCK